LDFKSSANQMVSADRRIKGVSHKPKRTFSWSFV
jgi:hypothetical protein